MTVLVPWKSINAEEPPTEFAFQIPPVRTLLVRLVTVAPDWKTTFELASASTVPWLVNFPCVKFKPPVPLPRTVPPDWLRSPSVSAALVLGETFSATVPVASMVPLLTMRIDWPAPIWPAPEMVLSTLVSTSRPVLAAPQMRLLPLLLRAIAPPPVSWVPPATRRSVRLPPELTAIVPVLLIVPDRNVEVLFSAT